MGRSIIITSRDEKRVIPSQLKNRYNFNGSTIFEGAFYFINLDGKGKLRMDASLSRYEVGTRMEKTSLLNWTRIAKPYEDELWIVCTGNSPVGVDKSDLNDMGGEADWLSQPTLNSYRGRLIKNLTGSRKKLDERIITKVFAPLERRVKNALGPADEIKTIEESWE